MLWNEGFDAQSDTDTDIADNWMESRLFRGLSEPDRELLLDVGLFDWLDAGLLDAVLDTSGAKRRVEAIPALAGLLESVGDGPNGRLRLHALIREHCGRWRLRHTPERFRRIHRRIAERLAQRGEIVVAMRHAVEAADMVLAGDILENAGGVWWWVREGLPPLQAADRLLTEELVAQRPRLALVRCLVTLLTGRLGDARVMYRAVADRHPDGVGDSGAEDLAYRADDTMARGLLAIYGCERCATDEAKALISDEESFVADDRIDPSIRSYFDYALCVDHNLTANFDLALERADRVQRCHARGQLHRSVYRAVARTDRHGAGRRGASRASLREGVAMGQGELPA